MHQNQQRFIVFALFITVSYAQTVIELFDAKDPTGLFGSHNTIFDTHIQLWAKVKGCPEATCNCKVKTEELADDPKPLQFLSDPNKEIGYLTITGLQPYTSYTFRLTCGDDKSAITVIRTLRTDFGRPSAPENIKTTLVDKHVKVTWSPVTPAESFSHYKIIIDNKPIPDNIAKSESSYHFKQEYVLGTEHKIRVQACYINFQQYPICSNLPKEDTAFFMPTPAPSTTTTTTATGTTTTATATTTTKSIGVQACSISILTILSCLLLLS